MTGMVKKYFKRPVAIEAIQWTGDNYGEILEFMGDKVFTENEKTEEVLFIHTLEGVMRATKGDYIIRGVEGEFYPCKPDIFAKTYKEAD